MPLSPHIPNAPQRQPRPRNDLNDVWASDSTTFWSSTSPSTSAFATTPTTSDIPQNTATQISIPESTPISSIPLPSDGITTLVFTTTIPATTIAQPGTTFTSFTELLITEAVTPTPTSSSSILSSSTTSATFSAASLIESRSGPVCPGQGFDSAATGILSVIIAPTAVGLFLWVSSVHAYASCSLTQAARFYLPF